MTSLPIRRRPERRRLLRATLATVLVGAASAALAHATIVFGTLTTSPNPPPTGTTFAFELTLDDPAGAPVEDAVVRAELTPATPDGVRAEPDGAAREPLVETRFQEVEPGVYRAELTVPEGGTYRILLRDQTFQQEEATQVVSMRIGAEEPLAPIDFLFPPTATGGNLGTWLLWLVAIPLVAGIVVTILVLRQTPDTADAADAADAAGQP